MKKNIEQAINYMQNWYINNYGDYADIYFEESYSVAKQELNKLEKHKNDLGDLLAKREEQLDKIKEVVNNIKTLSGDNYDYEQLNKIKQILEE